MNSAASADRPDVPVCCLRASTNADGKGSGASTLPFELLEELRGWSDRELVELEDELDFYTFTGAQGPQLRKLIDLF